MPTTRKEQLPEPQPTSVDETSSLAELEAQLASLKQQAADLQAVADAARPAPPVDSTPLPEDRLASEATEEEVARAEVLRDPYDSTNALKILANPPGKVLRWLSLVYREMRQMRGWQAVTYSDAIGREIHRYIAEPPARMVASSKLDDVVRRGDVFLAWIDKGIWMARQRKREAEANRRIISHVTKKQQPVGKHAFTTDQGLSMDANPYQELRAAPHFVAVTPKDYRARAKGTINDPSIRVKGNNLFEEAPEEE